MGGELSKYSCIKSGRRRNKAKCRKSKPAHNNIIEESDDHAEERASTLDPLSRTVIRQDPTVSTNGQQSVSATGESRVSKVVLIPTKELRNIQDKGGKISNKILNEFMRASPDHCQKLGNILEDPSRQNDISKKIGNSIELLDCPDMSTISMQTADVSSAINSERADSFRQTTSKESPVRYQQMNNELTRETQAGLGDISTATSLTVPPNSVNSQFISGITPLDSVLEQDNFDPEISNDSVFAYDNVGVPQYYLGANGLYYATYPDRKVFLNNNSIMSPDPADQSSKFSKTQRNQSIIGEVSSGPGLDSDFGASAGIEMRIVSSDYSGITDKNVDEKQAMDDKSITQNNLTVPRKRSTKRQKLTTRPSPRVILRASQGFVPAPAPAPAPPQDTSNVDGSSTNVTPLTMTMLRTPDARFCHPRTFRGRPRPATIAGPEATSFHVTMEWDPYDTGYGNEYWMEYFIPGVSYPPCPQLSADQYWL